MNDERGVDYGSLFLCLPKGFVFVSGGAADVAHSRQFADVELPVLVSGIVAKKGSRDILFANLWLPDLLGGLVLLFFNRVV